MEDGQVYPTGTCHMDIHIYMCVCMYIHTHVCRYGTLTWKTDLRIIHARSIYTYEHVCVYVYSYT